MANYTENLNLMVVDDNDAFGDGTVQGNYNANRLDTLIADLPSITENFGTIVEQVTENTSDIDGIKTVNATQTTQIAQHTSQINSIIGTRLDASYMNSSTTPTIPRKHFNFLFTDRIANYVPSTTGTAPYSELVIDIPVSIIGGADAIPFVVSACAYNNSDESVDKGVIPFSVNAAFKSGSNFRVILTTTSNVGANGKLFNGCITVSV